MIESIATNIELVNGIYYAKSHSQISYPTDGNADCMQLEDDSFWFRHRNNCITELVKKFSPNNIFFDIGGGNGFVAAGLQQQGIETVLVEPGEEGALNAKKRGVRQVICATMAGAGFKDSVCQAVGLFDVVEHIEDDVDFMKTINKSMTVNGFVYITVPAYNFLWSDEDDYAGHYRRYTIKTLQELLIKTGFETVFTAYIFSVLPLPVFLFRSLPSKLGMSRKSGEIGKYKKEHSKKNGIIGKLMDKVWDWELERIKTGKSIIFGGSCLVVAKKT